MYYTIIISSFAFLWSHGHNCDRDRFLPKLGRSIKGTSIKVNQGFEVKNQISHNKQ